MSGDEQRPSAQDEMPMPMRKTPAESGTRRGVARVIAWIAGGIGALLILLIAGTAWYATTDDFQRRVANQLVSVLEDSTGGRVEIGRIHFSLWRLSVEVNGLVVHGLEGPGEAPYLSADKVQVRVRITSFLAHMAGAGIASHVALDLLRVEHPQVHLIVDKDGHTNQPVPKHPSTSMGPVQDTLLDLKATEVDLASGVFLLNDRAIPFNADARDLNAQVKYLRATDRYGITLDLNDLRTQMQAAPQAQSDLHLAAELGRDMVQVTKFDFSSGASSALHATASLTHFAEPEWQAKLNGAFDLRQVSVLTAFDGLTGGSVDLDLNAHSCAVAPAVAQARPHFWQRHKPPMPANPTAAKLPPSPECKAGYLVAGSTKIHKAGFANKYVKLHDVDGGAQLHITPTELLLTALTGYLPGGGSAAGELRIEDWLGETAASGPAKSPTAAAAVTTVKKTAITLHAKPPASTPSPPIYAHAYLTAALNAIPLRTIMDVTERHGYSDLGFDTAISGPVKVEWGGPAKDIADTVVVDGDLKLHPTGARRPGALNNVPVTGEAVARYDGSREVVNIDHVTLLTPASSTQASGVLGVNRGDPLTSLRVDMNVRDLGEFDQLLQTLGFSANGRKGAAAVPVVLHGGVDFHGTAAGRAANLDFKGHLEGNAVEVKLD
ncbi:MAG TPA: translocation/assembly module TamB, partial [Acidobacteriaceae bacterium]